MRFLVDTSVWIDHFREAVPELSDALSRRGVLCHPDVIGELAMGSLARRAQTLEALCELPSAPTASDAEVRVMVEQEGLFARGLSWTDAHLLASTRLRPGTILWSRDKRLARAAVTLGLA